MRTTKHMQQNVLVHKKDIEKDIIFHALPKKKILSVVQCVVI